jgi:hypothetical protein
LVELASVRSIFLDARKSDEGQQWDGCAMAAMKAAILADLNSRNPVV